MKKINEIRELSHILSFNLDSQENQAHRLMAVASKRWKGRYEDGNVIYLSKERLAENSQKFRFEKAIDARKDYSINKPRDIFNSSVDIIQASLDLGYALLDRRSIVSEASAKEQQSEAFKNDMRFHEELFNKINQNVIQETQIWMLRLNRPYFSKVAAHNSYNEESLHYYRARAYEQAAEWLPESVRSEKFRPKSVDGLLKRNTALIAERFILQSDAYRMRASHYLSAVESLDSYSVFDFNKQDLDDMRAGRKTIISHAQNDVVTARKMIDLGNLEMDAILDKSHTLYHPYAVEPYLAAISCKSFNP